MVMCQKAHLECVAVKGAYKAKYQSNTARHLFKNKHSLELNNQQWALFDHLPQHPLLPHPPHLLIMAAETATFAFKVFVLSYRP